MREIISVNDNWYFKKTTDIPGKIFENWEQVVLPHTWNAEDGQDGGNDYWRGTGCYVRNLDKPEGKGRTYLEINGAANICDVYLNGEKLAHHEGGFSTFRVDLTDNLSDKNTLVLSVDNSENDRVYPQKADFTFYGGVRTGNIDYRKDFSEAALSSSGVKSDIRKPLTHAKYSVISFITLTSRAAMEGM